MPRKPSELEDASELQYENPQTAQMECLWLIACQLERIADALEEKDA